MLPPALERAGTGAEIIIMLIIKPKGFRRNTQKDRYRKIEDIILEMEEKDKKGENGDEK